MRTSKIMQRTGLVMMLIAVAVVAAAEAQAVDYLPTQSADKERRMIERVQERDTFYNEDSVDRDGPEQDPKYDEDDPKWDELDNSVNEEGSDDDE